MQSKIIKIHKDDNVAVALTQLYKGEEMSNQQISKVLLTENIPSKHKFALKDFNEGDPVIMYGVLVGKALKFIPEGGLLSTQNLQHATNSFSLKERNTSWHKPDVSAYQNKTFNGFHRADGSVGTRNYWLVIPMVFCENKNVAVLEEAFMKALGYLPKSSLYEAMVYKLISEYESGNTGYNLIANEEGFETKNKKIFPNVDGIKFLNHTLGCGGTREDARSLCGLLAGYITHSNVAGATVLSLGCQHAQLAILKEEIEKRDTNFSKPLYLLEQQKISHENILLAEAIKKTFTGLSEANKLKREPAPLNKLCIGLECGASDGFSGISANPAIGYTSDILVALGGSVILSEFPELCGVEQELSDRCTDDATAEKFIHIMTTYNKRAMDVGSGFYANPSPGNIRDGLITDAIKSAGAAKKGGTSPVSDVMDYPGKVTKQGLNLLCTPGSDVESTTAEVGAGANVVLFTTGLGTPTGNPVAPVLKLSTNTSLYNKMNDIIDIDTGTIIEANETIEAAGKRILDYIISVANGDVKAKAETTFHDDFIPWKRGISL